MHTLAQLKAGQLQGISRLQLSEDLTEFPREIFELADSLEILDLSNNQLTQLPDDLHRLTQMKILFMSDNRFTELPAVLGQCPKLEMIGFKSNQIHTVPAESLPQQTRWLILTNNRITALPERMGELQRLQKLALAGNQLTSLPSSMAQCENLELVRLSANRLQAFPDVLLSLPKLAWLAFSGNPFCPTSDRDGAQVPLIKRADLELHQVLGQGASGLISKASWVNNPLQLPEPVAVKVFKGEVTSDGYPADELHACLTAGAHPQLVKPLARIEEDGCSALVMKLIPDHFTNLGQPPSLASCTRDTFKAGFELEVHTIGYIVEQMTDVAQHLQRKQVSHGDLYAHNVLIDADGTLLFGDFGAASCYDMLTRAQQEQIVRIEQRALGLFIDDLLSICAAADRETETYHSLALLSQHYLAGS